MRPPDPSLPAALRWLAFAWLAVYVPSYAMAYPLSNFLFLCNLSAALTAWALWRGSVLLLSSQAVALPLIGAVWSIDVLSRVLTGHHVIGGTAYMWDARLPLFTRLLSLYHVAMPLVQAAALRRVGYDRGGYALQAGIAVTAVIAGRWCDPQANVNFAFADPFFGRQWGGPVTHVASIAGALVLVVYPLMHLALARAFPPPSPRPSAG
jgi:hypothetical protein